MLVVLLLLAAFVAGMVSGSSRPAAIETPELPLRSVSFTEIKPIAPWINDAAQNGGYKVFDPAAFPAYAVAIHNPTPSKVTVEGADFVIDSASAVRGHWETPSPLEGTSPEKYVSAWISSPQIGQRVRIPAALTLEPGNSGCFTVWFQSTAAAPDGLLLLTGHLSLDDGRSTSERFRVLIPARGSTVPAMAN
jgi:hypothetical protein